MKTVPALIAATLLGLLAVTAVPAAEDGKTQTHRAGEVHKDDRTAKSGETQLAICEAPRLPGPLELASRLDAYETFLGIRPAQSEAWRDYTDALQAMALGPEAERRELPVSVIADSDALGQSATLAGAMIDAGERATRLLASIDTLRAALSEAQKTRLNEAGALFPPKCAGTLAEAGEPAKDILAH